MRAAWGALKGAVQELNDALLEDDDEYNERSRTDKHQGHIKDFKQRNDHVDNHFNSNISKKVDFEARDSSYSNDNNRNNFASGKGSNHLSQPNSLNGNLLLDSNKHSKQNIIMLQDSESSGENNSVVDEDFGWGLDMENDSKVKPDSKANQFTNNMEYTEESNLEQVVNLQGTKEQCSDMHTRTSIINEEFHQSGYSDDEEEGDANNTSELIHDNNSLNNSEDDSIIVTEDDEDSNLTDTLEEDDEKTVSNTSDQENIGIFSLTSEYSTQLSEIFQMEINDVDYLLEVIQGYYTDWKGIRDSLISDKELLIELSPPHLESYLKNTVLDNSKPFSLGFTILIGQCVHLFLQELKKKASQISEQENKINELLQKNLKYSTINQTIEAENIELNKKISFLEDETRCLIEKNQELENKFQDEYNKKDQVDHKRVEDLELERNNLIEKINQMIAEKDESKIEVENLHNHINNLTSIIEGYQAEEEQINSRYEIELERARSQERKLQSRLSVLDSCQDEIGSLKENVAKLEEDRILLKKHIDELEENNKNLFNSNEQIIKQLKDTKDEQKEFMIDKRFIIQIIQKHNQDGSQIKYRNDLFNLLCDVIGISEEEKSNLFNCDNRNNVSNSNENVINDLNQGMGFADLFYNFLNSEVEGNTQEAK